MSAQDKKLFDDILQPAHTQESLESCSADVEKILELIEKELPPQIHNTNARFTLFC